MYYISDSNKKNHSIDVSNSKWNNNTTVIMFYKNYPRDWRS